MTSNNPLGRRGEFEFRAERLGTALRDLAAALVEERRTVAELRREVARLTAELESLQPTQEEAVDRDAGSPPTTAHGDPCAKAPGRSAATGDVR